MKRIRNIGSGGFGIVDLYQNEEGKQFALKQMQNNWTDEVYQRFVREVKIMINLKHPNIVPIIKYDIHNGSPWFIMPYYKKGSLREKLLELRAEGNVYTSKGASGLIVYLAKALIKAHDQNIIHRDLKPENIFFEDKNPMIGDWGIGKFLSSDSKVLTQEGIGTPIYCAPEQWQNVKIDGRADIYSLGIIFRELLTGNVFGEVKDFNLNVVVKKMTELSPNDRYQTMEDVVKAIEKASEVSKKEPLKDFWNSAAIVLAVVGIVAVVAKLSKSD